MNLQELNQEKNMTSAELRQKYKLYPGAQHPSFPKHWWRIAVSEQRTEDGYWDWLVTAIKTMTD